MSAVFDRTSFGRRELEPYWQTDDQTAVEKQGAGIPNNYFGHKPRSKARIDGDQAKQLGRVSERGTPA